MFADVGSLLLWIALVVSLYAFVASITGKLFIVNELVVSSYRGIYVLLILCVASTICLVGSFVTNDFSVIYVAAHSNLAMPNIYTWVAFYAGNEGSLLFIATVLSVIIGIAIKFKGNTSQDVLPAITAVLMFVMTFFLAVIIFMADPFQKSNIPVLDGQGINPLLTHFGMFFHPPALMSGLICCSIPMAFSLGHLICGKSQDEWVDQGRVWGLIAWATLAIGLLLGSWWAYTILGWGGFWFWDPVENAAFMPWVALTAFIHSIIVQKRRSMFRIWNIVIINIVFALSLYGMFVNRGGPVPSVHSFGASDLGWVFLGFLCVGIVIPFGIFLYRLGKIRSERSLESMLSREAAFLINNLLLLGIAFVTLWGTVYPLISDLLFSEQITIARPYYDQVNGPIMLVLLLVMGIGPLIPWRNSNYSVVLYALKYPLIVTVLVFGLLVVLGIDDIIPLISFSIIALVTTGIAREWYKGTKVMSTGNWVKAPGAFLRLIMANRTRYGGYIVHVSVLMVALGVVGASFYDQQRDVIMQPGEEYKIDDYEIIYLGTEEAMFSDRTEFTSIISVQKNGDYLTEMNPKRSFYPSFNMASTRAAIRSTPIEDFYVVPSENMPDGSVGFRFMINPLIWWMWVAGPFVILGTLISLWPRNTKNIPK